MESKYYTVEKAQQILIALLKEHRIRKVVASPGTTNLTFVASLQQDSYFEIYSSVDERSAAYIACGLSAETGEPVVLTCTGATASRNYMPGLTEAYYRKLPILAVTANSGIDKRGHLVAQQIDRSRVPVDVAKLSVDIPVVKDDTDAWLCNVNINKAILELTRNGGGPVHINISTSYNGNFSVKELPRQRVINRITQLDPFPILKEQKVAVFIGSHKKFSEDEIQQIERFCETHNSVVFCDHTSGYYGKYKMGYSLVCFQKYHTDTRDMDVLIHLGEVSGDYYGMGLRPKEVWRVSPDGEVRDTFHCLRYVFGMPESFFFQHYSQGENKGLSYYEDCRSQFELIQAEMPELPFGNIWMAKHLSKILPKGSVLHLGILNTLRSWNFFKLPDGVESFCNVGGFGIDGILSTVLGASLADKSKIYFCVVGDLAFLYDLNSLTNRHIGANVRIMLINNGRGTEFTNYGHLGHAFGENADPYIAAAGHFGNKSGTLVRDFAENLGFRYLTASNKQEFMDVYTEFVSLSDIQQPILFEVFTDSKDESDALEMMAGIRKDPPTMKQHIKNVIKTIVGKDNIDNFRHKVGI